MEKIEFPPDFAEFLRLLNAQSYLKIPTELFAWERPLYASKFSWTSMA